MQIYLVGYAQEADTHDEFNNDHEVIPAPFRKVQHDPLMNGKPLKPGVFLRYSIPRDRWKEVVVNPDLKDYEGDPLDYTPDMLLLPGTCKVDSKIFFFSGLCEEQGEFFANKLILTFDLESRKVGKMNVKFEFGPFTEMKCAKVSKKRIILLGGYDKDMEYNRTIFRYTVDFGLKAKKELLKAGFQFTDNNPPIGKYRFCVFFGYPWVFMKRIQTNRREYINISTPLGIDLAEEIHEKSKEMQDKEDAEEKSDEMRDKEDEVQNKSQEMQDIQEKNHS
jgi:hypothetical protein